jgi:hypothetical protein
VAVDDAASLQGTVLDAVAPCSTSATQIEHHDEVVGHGTCERLNGGGSRGEEAGGQRWPRVTVSQRWATRHAVHGLGGCDPGFLATSSSSLDFV